MCLDLYCHCCLQIVSSSNDSHNRVGYIRQSPVSETSCFFFNLATTIDSVQKLVISTIVTNRKIVFTSVYVTLVII
jgi:hypothetical protein